MIEELIRAYGYPIIFLGTIVEGETPLLLGGLAAHRGYLDLSWVIAIAFAGGFAGDEAWFFLGRRYGPSLLARRPAWRPRIARIDRLLARHPLLFVLGFRFIYGLRTIAPIAIGLTRMGALRFVALNAAGAALWAAAIGFAGYFFGAAIERVLGRASRYEAAIFGGIAAIGALALLAHWFLRRRAERAGAKSGPS